MAANREERYDRPSLPPAWIGRGPTVFAGRDRQAGGTWQGVNQSGLLVALTNRTGGDENPQRRSRGLLCVDVLCQRSAHSAVEWLQDHLSTHPYNPCNLLCTDVESAFAVHHDGTVTEVLELSPGIHFLSETDVDDPHHPRIQRARALLKGKTRQGWPGLRHTLAQVMADHGDGCPPEQRICLHGEMGGTVSSSIIALSHDSLKEARFLFAPGPPCTHAYEDLSTQLDSPTVQSLNKNH